MDSDKNFKDALDRWEPEDVLGTVKRKRMSGHTNTNNEFIKEIEVIL